MVEPVLMAMFKFTFSHYCTSTYSTLGHKSQQLTLLFLQDPVAAPFRPGELSEGMAVVRRPHGAMLARGSLLFLYCSSTVRLLFLYC